MKTDHMPRPETNGNSDGDVDMVLVTGASGSIGRATIRSFTSKGFRVVTIDNRSLPRAEAQLVSHAYEVDLTDDDAVRAALVGLDKLGSLCHVIAIAGGGDVEELAQSDPATESVEIFARVLQNNLTIAFTTIRHTVPFLRAGRGDRSIILVGSINAFGGYGAPAYSAAKAGLTGLANSLATPLGADGIRINCLALGTVDTENLRLLASARGVVLDLASVASRAPLRRVLTAEDVATAMRALAVEMPGLTGATVILDNGQTHIR
jgi:NAD(P)-dependent dehydrogenase (short-subunit alcohol dehydrogenase family)